MCPAYLCVRWCTLWTLLFNFGLFSIPLGETSLAAHFPEVVLQSIICYRMPLSSAYPTLMCRIKLFNFAMWMSVFFCFVFLNAQEFIHSGWQTRDEFSQTWNLPAVLWYYNERQSWPLEVVGRRVGWCLALGWLLFRVHCGLIVAVQGEIDKGSHYTTVCVDVSLLESSNVF